MLSLLTPEFFSRVVSEGLKNAVGDQFLAYGRAFSLKGSEDATLQVGRAGAVEPRRRECRPQTGGRCRSSARSDARQRLRCRAAFGSGAGVLGSWSPPLFCGSRSRRCRLQVHASRPGHVGGCPRGGGAATGLEAQPAMGGSAPMLRIASHGYPRRRPWIVGSDLTLVSGWTVLRSSCAVERNARCSGTRSHSSRNTRIRRGPPQRSQTRISIANTGRRRRAQVQHLEDCPADRLRISATTSNP